MGKSRVFKTAVLTFIMLAAVELGQARADQFYEVGPGRTYTSISDARIHVSDKDCVAQGENIIFELYGRWRERLELFGWTCNENYSLIIRPGAGEDHPGIYYDDTVMANDYILKIRSDCDYVKLEGIWVYGNSQVSLESPLYVEADHVEARDCIFDTSDGQPFIRVTVDNHGGHLLLDNCVVKGNIALDSYYSSGHMEIANCTFQHSVGVAIQCSGDGNRIHHNRFIGDFETGSAGRVISNYGSNLMFYNNFVNASSSTDEALYMRTGSSNSDSYIINNTFYGSKSAGSSCIYVHDVTYGQVWVRNNIAYVHDGCYGLNYKDATDLFSDNNCVYVSSGGFYGMYNGADCSDLAAFQAASGLESYSVAGNLDPLFLGLDRDCSNWLRLSYASPCIGNGANLSALITTDYEWDVRPSSNAWTIGADYPVPKPEIIAVYGNYSAGGTFSSGDYGNLSDVYFTWDCTSQTTGCWWYWGTAPPAGDNELDTLENAPESPVLTAEHGWNYFYILATDGSTNSGMHSFTYYYDGSIPEKPSPCYCEGEVDPDNVTYAAPHFTAVYNDNAGDSTTAVYLEVGTDSNWANAEMWNSGWLSITETASGNECPAVQYAGLDLANSTSYYWRVQFRDRGGNTGLWSDTQTFSTGIIGERPVTVTVGPVGCDYENVSLAQDGIDAGDLAGLGVPDRDLVSAGKSVDMQLVGKWQEAVDISGWTTNSTCYVRVSSGGGSPTLYEDTDANYTFRISDNYVYVDGLHLISNDSGTTNYCLKLNSASHVYVSGCLMDSGGPSNSNVCMDLYGSDVYVSGCTFTGWSGIVCERPGISGVDVSGCVFHDLDCLSFYKRYITDMKVHECAWYGDSGPYGLYVRNFADVSLYNNKFDAGGIGQYAIYALTTDSSNLTSYITSNTVYDPDAGTGAIRLDSVQHGTTHVQNNLVFMNASAVGLDFSASTSANVAGDNNCVYDASGTGYFGSYSSTPYSTENDWSAATGMDNNSISADPLFISVDTGNSDWLNIAPSSPCLGVGTNFYSVYDVDYDGSSRHPSEPWSIGADDFNSVLGAYNLAGYFGTHSAAGASFTSGSWGASGTVHFTWDARPLNVNHYWYWGQTAPSGSGDYADNTVETWTESHVAAAGVNYFYVIATDGVVNSTEAVFTYYYDDTPPSDVTITCWGDSNRFSNFANAVSCSEPSPFFDLSSDDAESGLVRYYYYWGAQADGTPNAETTDNSFEPGALAAGTYYLRVTAANGAGANSASVGVFQFIYDGNAPQATNLSCFGNTHSAPGGAIAASSWGAEGTVHFTWDCNTYAAGFYWYWGTTPPVSWSDYSGYETEAFTESHAASHGVNYFYLMATGSNVNADAITFEYYFDDSAPLGPSSCYCEGMVNAADITNFMPDFTATYLDDAGDVANAAWIEVWDAATLAEMYNSGWIATASDVLPGDNCDAITYSSATALDWGTTYNWRIRFRDKAGNEGSWSAVQMFSTVPGTPPSAAASPSPSDGEANVSVIGTTLSWTDPSNATGFYVYFGTTSGSLNNEGSYTTTSYDPGNMSSLTTYYWRIDSYNQHGAATGTQWHFVTEEIPSPPPPRAENPSPSNGAKGVNTNVTLSWDPAENATAYYVYFGTDSAALDNQGSVVSTSWGPGGLDDDRYYWRIDPYNKWGVRTGEVWSFTVGDDGGGGCGCALDAGDGIENRLGMILPALLMIFALAYLRRKNPVLSDSRK